MKKTLIVTIFAFFVSISFAQQTVINGYVSDIETGEKLISAIVFEEGTNNVVSTNEFGYFTLNASNRDSIIITVHYLSYSKQTKIITDKQNKLLNFQIKQNNTIDEVVILGEQSFVNKNETSIIEIPINQMQTLPALGGETDIFKAIQLMPGIQSGSEGRNSLYVRGGSPDQNLILLDDVPLYYVSHLGGFVSVFNTDALKKVKLYKGGFPARYGGRLSSVIDVRMKEGNMKELKVKGTLGLISSKLAIEAPIIKDKTSFMISGRRFMLDLLSKPLSSAVLEGVSAGYTFYDINAKVNHIFSDKSRLYLSIYTGNDKISTKYAEKRGNETYKSNNAWGNSLISLRWNYIPGKKVFVNTTFSYTKYRYLLETEYSGESLSYNYNTFSGIEDLLFKTDFTYSMKHSSFKLGLHSIYHTFSPKISTFIKKSETNSQDLSFSNDILNAYENDAYIEYDIDIFTWLSINSGLRYTSYVVEKTNFQNISPRVLLNFKLSEKQSIKTSLVNMQQNLHLLINSGTGIPSDIWMPATKNIQPEKSKQITVGTSRLLKENVYEFSAELYYKEMSNLITYKEGASFFKESDSWEDKVEKNGKGKSYGIELLIQKKHGQMTGWVSYTLAKTDRQFNNINNGDVYPFKYDRRHDFSIVYNYKIKKHVHFSATWQFGSGYPITLAYGYFYAQNIRQSENGFYDNSFYPVDLYEGKNNFRMRSYHKLDMGISFTKQKKWGERVWMISIYNVYNRRNPYYYYIDEEFENQPKLYQMSFFPFIPSFSYSFSF